jgi:hypothetical protein
MKPLRTFALGTLIFISVLSACRGTAPVEVSTTKPNAYTPEPASTVPPKIEIIERATADDASIVPRDLAEKTKTDLAKYLNIDGSQIRVVESISVDWPDTSLGCPQPDMAYAQVVTPGYWIVLETNGLQYPYHTDLEGQVILCLKNTTNSLYEETPPLPIIPVNPTEIQDGQPWVPVN